jgi:hypothetical protein
MAEDQTESRDLAPTRPGRPTIIVQSQAAIFDSGKFEHLYRVATVMAKAGLMPESLTHIKVRGARNEDQLEPLPQDVVIARAFLIAAQADRWRMDPLGLMNCCYLAHNKLGYEGKAVHAAIQSIVGVTLSYQYGSWDQKTLRVLINTPPPQPDMLGIVVSAMVDGELKTIEGSVGSWKHDFAGKELPAWKSPGAWPRMLRYRGAREWCNAHTPHVTLGVLTEDDFSAPESPQIQFLDVAPVTPRQLDEALGRAGATKAAAGAPAGVKAATGKAPAATGEGAKPAPAADKGKPTPDSATAASKGSPASSGSGPKPQSAPTSAGSKESEISQGFIDPDTGEVYPTMEARLVAEDAKKAAAAKVVDFPGDRRASVEQSDPRDAKTDPLQEEGAAESDGAEVDQSGADDQETGPPDEEGEIDTDSFNAFVSDIRATSTWADFKGALIEFRDGEAFAAAPLDLQRQAMVLAYDHAIEKGFGSPDGDVAWFRLWLWTLAWPSPAARPAFRKVMRGGQFLSLPEAERNADADEATRAGGE